MPPPFHLFSAKAQQAIQKAHEVASERGLNHVNSFHLLLAILTLDYNPAVAILEKMGINQLTMIDTILDKIEVSEDVAQVSQVSQMFLSPDLAGVLDKAMQYAKEMNEKVISIEHLLIGIVHIHPMRRLMSFVRNTRWS
jgi:ATP-dependent Clp protease ATP-binding subunit ClpB